MLENINKRNSMQCRSIADYQFLVNWDFDKMSPRFSFVNLARMI